LPIVLAGVVCAGVPAHPATASPIAPAFRVRAADAPLRALGSARESVRTIVTARDVPEPASRLLLVTSLLVLMLYGAWFSTARPSDHD
jgi:hypothetical protein